MVVTGNVTKDAETFFGESGKAVTKFSVASNERHGEKEYVEFTNVVMFGKPAEWVAGTIKKGDRVCAIGKKSTKKWVDRDGNNRYSTDLVAWEVYGTITKKDSGETVVEKEDDMPF